MNLDLVSRLVRDAVHLPPGPHMAARALFLVPALADALPEVPLPTQGRLPQFPVGCSDLLSGAVERALRMALDDAMAEVRPPPLAELTERLREDPLARGLRRLLQEAASLSPGAAGVVALDYARQCAATLANPGPLLRESVAGLAALPPERRGPALARVAAPMQARLALAASELAASGTRPPALISAIAVNPLVFLFAKGGFAEGLDLPFLAGVTGAAIDPELARDAVICFDTALGETLSRLEGGKATPADHVFALRFNLAELGQRATAVLRAEPDAWAHLMPQLAGTVSAGALLEAGAVQARAVELCRPDVGTAVAATFRATLRTIQVWEVLAAVIACVVPTGEPSIERQLLVPRGGATIATIVAVSTGMMRTAVSEPVALSREVAEAVAGWRASLGAHAVASDDGAVALFAFSDPYRGISFALSLRERPAAGLPVPAAAVATGTVSGGTDGAVVRLSGPAVQDALRLLAHSPLDMRLPDSPVLSQLGLIDGTLRGSGVAAHTSVLDALRSKRLKRAGRGRPAWANEAWEDDLGVLALITVPGLGDASELARCAPADWEALCAAGEAPPKPAAAKPASAPKPAASPPPAAARPAPPPPRTTSRDDLAQTAPRPIVAMPDRDADEEPAAEGPRDSSHEVRRPQRRAPTPEAEPPVIAVPPPVIAVPPPAQPAFEATSAFEAAPAFDAAPSFVQPAPAEPAPPEEAPVMGAAFLFESTEADPFAAPPAAPAPTPERATAAPAGDPFAHRDPFASPPPSAPPASASRPPSAPFASADPFAGGDPFSAPASPPPAAAPAPAVDAFAATEAVPAAVFDNIFGVPVGDNDAPPPTAPPPAIGAMGFVVDDAPPVPAARIDAPGEGFSLPVYEGAPGSPGPTVGASSPEPRKAKRNPVVDFDFLLKGYACYVERGRVAFGRPYGTRLVDLHVYDTGGDMDRAYQSFMEAKIREGFIPQTELTGDLPRTVTVMPLDPERLADAWRTLT